MKAKPTDSLDVVQIRRTIQRFNQLASDETPLDIVSTSENAGSSVQFSRDDHTHKITLSVIGGLVLSDTTPTAVSTTALAGTGNKASRYDHVHNITQSTIGGLILSNVLPQNVGLINVAGTGLKASREDHIHALSAATVAGLILTNNLPSDVSTSSSAGVGVLASRYDHVHNISSSTIAGLILSSSSPSNVSYTASAGSGSLASKYDHVHVLPSDLKGFPTITVDNLNVLGDIIIEGTIDGVNLTQLQTDIDGFPDELKNLTTAEIQQLENINSLSISNTEWGYLAELDQSVKTTASPSFASLALTGTLTVNTINEYTTNNGVSIEGVALKDGDITLTTGNYILIDGGKLEYSSGELQVNKNFNVNAETGYTGILQAFGNETYEYSALRLWAGLRGSATEDWQLTHKHSGTGFIDGMFSITNYQHPNTYKALLIKKMTADEPVRLEGDGRVGINIASVTAGCALTLGDDLNINATDGGILFYNDITLSRGAANRLDLAAGDSIRVQAGGELQVKSTAGETAVQSYLNFTDGTNEIKLYQDLTAGNILNVSSGDSIKLASDGCLYIDGGKLEYSSGELQVNKNFNVNAETGYTGILQAFGNETYEYSALRLWAGLRGSATEDWQLTHKHSGTGFIDGMFSITNYQHPNTYKALLIKKMTADEPVRLEGDGRVGINIASVTAGCALTLGDDLNINATDGGILFYNDITLSRGAANRLDLAAGDSIRVQAGGELQVKSTAGETAVQSYLNFTDGTNEIKLYQDLTAGNILNVSSGDSIKLASDGCLYFGDDVAT